jgi:hypothetical protein
MVAIETPVNKKCGAFFHWQSSKLVIDERCSDFLGKMTRNKLGAYSQVQNDIPLGNKYNQNSVNKFLKIRIHTLGILTVSWFFSVLTCAIFIFQDITKHQNDVGE